MVEATKQAGLDLSPDSEDITSQKHSQPQPSDDLQLPNDHHNHQQGKDPLDELLAQDGIEPLANRRENRIPYSKVKKIVANAQTKVKADYEQKVAAYQQHVSQIQNEISHLGNIMQTDPTAFLKMLADADPRYAEALSQRSDAADPPYAADPPSLSSGGAPGPDIQFADGSLGYSPEQQAHRDQWLIEQAEARAEARIAKRYAPIEQQYKTQALIQQAMPKVQQQLQEAQTWPLFNEYHNDILQTLKADTNISLEGAYLKVVGPKLQADRNRIREDVLKEINAKPHGTSAASSTASTSPKEMSLEDKMLAASRAAGLL
jgi:hypothetical protein